jgi:hypothetical protein
MTQKSSTATPATRTRYGNSNPERVENELWEMVVRRNWSGYQLGEHLNIRRQACLNPSLSSYRETEPGPFWSWQRFGRSRTPLPDGRVIHIAGEHEDSYDPDFCIYNDVIVENQDGSLEFYLYPKDVFPPTDAHSATLIGDEIFLIGSIGYHDLRRAGETQVLKLDTRTLRIEHVATSGDGPGWISRHTAAMLNETSILITGGKVQTEKDYETNTGIFELDLTTRTWRRRKHGDMSIFPVSEETYLACRNPRYGTANPERIDNPFWLEMARRQWPASRARVHFGDVAPAREEDDTLADGPAPDLGTPAFDAWMRGLSARIAHQKLARRMEDVVWTSVREDSLKLTLADGRHLLIGGEVLYYGDEAADAWGYNDVVVTKPDGAIEILAYPKEDFPPLGFSAGVVHEGYIYIFGTIDGDRHPERRGGIAVLCLHADTYALAEIPVNTPPARPNIYAGGTIREGNRVVFPVVRQTDADPERGIAFDLGTLSWSSPFPHRHPREDD